MDEAGSLNDNKEQRTPISADNIQILLCQVIKISGLVLQWSDTLSQLCSLVFSLIVGYEKLHSAVLINA